MAVRRVFGESTTARAAGRLSHADEGVWSGPCRCFPLAQPDGWLNIKVRGDAFGQLIKQLREVGETHHPGARE